MPAVAPSSGADEPLKVLNVAGSGRSGSTLLSNLLGQLARTHAAGEVFYLWERGLAESRLCGCGERISECELWREAIERALGGPSRERIAWMAEWTRHLTRTRRLPARLLRREGGLHGAGAREYLELMERLYLELAAASGANAIVDASKNPLYGHLLTRSKRIEVYCLHLVRDPRAVAFSWQRRRWNPDSNRPFARLGPSRSALIWLVWNRATEALLGAPRRRYLRIRYEDFCRRGEETLTAIAELAAIETAGLPFAADGTFRFVPHHAVAGNPVRFTREPRRLVLDEEWRANIRPADRLWVTLLTLSLLRRYGYASR